MGRKWGDAKAVEAFGRICELLAQGESLRAICARDGMPRRETVLEWVHDEDRFPGMSIQYARAREFQADYWADEIIEIADDSTGDWVETDKGRVVDHENIQRARLRVEIRKWLMSKLRPGQYGDSIRQEVTGKDGGPIAVEAWEWARKASTAELDEEIKRLEALALHRFTNRTPGDDDD